MKIKFGSISMWFSQVAQDAAVHFAFKLIPRAKRDKKLRRSKVQQIKTTNPEENSHINETMIARYFEGIYLEDRLSITTKYVLSRLETKLIKSASSRKNAEFGKHAGFLLADYIFKIAVATYGDEEVATDLDKHLLYYANTLDQYPDFEKRAYIDTLEKLKSTFKFEEAGKSELPATQIEKREVLHIRYSIQMRNAVKGRKISGEFKNFFTIVWSDAIAMSSMKNGPNHSMTSQFIKASNVLINIAERDISTRRAAFKNSPALLWTLSEGLKLVNIPSADKLSYLENFSGIKQAIV